MPGESGGPVVTNSCAFLFRTRGCGCSGHPASTAPSLGEWIRQNSGASRRGKAELYFVVIARSNLSDVAQRAKAEATKQSIGIGALAVDCVAPLAMTVVVLGCLGLGSGACGRGLRQPRGRYAKHPAVYLTGSLWRFPACSPPGPFQRIKVDCSEPVPKPMPLAAIVQRIRSFSLSIGQLTFGSFLLLLAVITATSMASVIAIRHIDSTFGDLQRLQGVGDLAEEIDRRMNELRLAARDFVTDPGARSDRVSEVASELNAVLKKTRLELAPEQQEMIDGVTQRLGEHPRGVAARTAPVCRRADTG